MKIRDVLNLRAVEGDVGVEIECEGKNLPQHNFGSWKAVPDGSLRNGIEYVFKKPLPVKSVEKAMEEISATFKEYDTLPDFSFRTSVHVHVNCLELEYNHLLNFIYTYLLLESVLMDFCGEARKCNRFCLRLEDAEGMIDVLREMFSYRDNPGNLRAFWKEDTMRYAALNVEALPKYGSLEFRAMHGTVDPEIIIAWTNILVNIRKFATKFEEPKDIVDYLDANGPAVFLAESAGDNYFDLLATDDFANRILFSNSMTIDLPYAEIKKVKKAVKIRLEDIDWKKEDVVILINEVPYSIHRLNRLYGKDVIDALTGCNLFLADEEQTKKTLAKEGRLHPIGAVGGIEALMEYQVAPMAPRRVRKVVPAPAPIAAADWANIGLMDDVAIVDDLEGEI